MDAMTKIRAIRAATTAAIARTGDKSLATHVESGKHQVVRISYGKRGVSTVSPLSGWLTFDELIGALNAL